MLDTNITTVDQKYFELDNPLYKANLEDIDWLELEDSIDIKSLQSPLSNYSVGDVDPVEETISYLLDPEYLHFAVRILLNVELAPYQLVALDMLWNKRAPMLIATRGGSKSYMLAVYCLLRMCLEPGCKIVIVGAALRQSRNVHEYMTTIWENSAILRDIAGNGKGTLSGPRREVDRYQFHIGGSSCIAIPLRRWLED